MAKRGPKLGVKRGPYKLSKTPEERFWESADRQPGPNGCWLWTGTITKAGYGILSVRKVRNLAHRFAYELLVGPIPYGLEIDHRCRVSHCCNPAHLEAVTHAENIRRSPAGVVYGMQQRAKTHCPQGHPYSGENLYVKRDGRRSCRTCERRRVQERRARLREVDLHGKVSFPTSAT